MKSIYLQFADKMMNICYRYTGNVHEAEDVLHNGFIKVFTKVDSLEKETSMESWIRTIMINECLMYLRSKYKFKLFENGFSEDLNMVVDENISKKLEAEDYYTLISELPFGYRTVFNLYAIEGYKHKEIAEMLDINESTSRSQLTKARNELKLKIKELK